MVAANTFRNPGLTAKLATTLDHLSDGRADPRPRRRLVRARARGVRARLRRRLRRAARSAGRGRPADPAPARRRAGDPRGPVLPDARRRRARRGPVQAQLPILIGGSGPRKTLPLVARYADLWNAYGTPERARRRRRDPARACTAIGRDEREIERTVNLNVVIRDSREEAERAGRTGSTPPARQPRRSSTRRHAGGGRRAAPPLSGRRVRTPGLRLPQPVRHRDDGPSAEVRALLDA